MVAPPDMELHATANMLEDGREGGKRKKKEKVNKRDEKETKAKILVKDDCECNGLMKEL